MSIRNRIFALIGFLGVLYIAFLLRQRGIQPSVDTLPSPQLFHWDPTNIEQDHGNVIAIHLGNDYSRVGFFDDDAFVLLVNDQGHTKTPNYVAFTDRGLLVGLEAKDQANENPQNTIYDFRRLLGQKFSDPCFQEEIKSLPYKVVDDSDRPRVQIQIKGTDRSYRPEEITAEILKLLKTTAEEYFSDKVTHAVIAVPANFNDAQRQATKDTATIAGLNVLRIINEPTAAGFAYDLDKVMHFEKVNRDRRYFTYKIIHGSDPIIQQGTMPCDGIYNDEYCFLVFNIEERNCDTTLMAVESGIYEMVSTASRQFGSQYFAHDLLAHAIDQFKAGTVLGMSEDFEAIERLKIEVKKAEETLLTNSSARIEIKSRDGTSGFFTTITRDQLQELHSNSYAEVLALVEQVLIDARLGEPVVDGLILTGDPSYVAKIQPVIEAYFEGAKLHSGLKSDELAVRGAAALARVLLREYDDLCMITLAQVTPLSLGIDTAGGLFTKIIPRNTVIPARKEKIFSTASENQEKVVLKIYTGERAMANDNKLLGTLELDGLSEKSLGELEIEVAFEVNCDFGLSVTAKERASGREVRAVFDDGEWGYERLEEVEEVLRDAEKYVEDDLRIVQMARENSWKGSDMFGVVLRDSDQHWR